MCRFSTWALTIESKTNEKKIIIHAPSHATDTPPVTTGVIRAFMSFIAFYSKRNFFSFCHSFAMNLTRSLRVKKKKERTGRERWNQRDLQKNI